MDNSDEKQTDVPTDVPKKSDSRSTTQLIVGLVIGWVVVFSVGYFFLSSNGNDNEATESYDESGPFVASSQLIRVDSIDGGYVVTVVGLTGEATEMRGPSLETVKKRGGLHDGPPSIEVKFDCPKNTVPYLEMIAENQIIRTEVHVHDRSDIGAQCQHFSPPKK